MRVMVRANVRGESPPGRFDTERLPRWDSAPLSTRRHERPNDHLLLFVSESTKQHLCPRARLELVVMDAC